MAGTDATPPPGPMTSDKVISRIETLERKVKELERLVKELNNAVRS